MKRDTSSFVLDDLSRIELLLESVSTEMLNYVKSHNDSHFYLFHKFLSHSDLPGFGKSTILGKPQDNLLYYFTNDEMNTMTDLSVAKQSNIHLSSEFYEKLGLQQPKGKNVYSLAQKGISVKIVNSTMKYFNSSYTEQVFKSLKKDYGTTKLKKAKWNFDELNVALKTDNPFTEIDVHVAAHGIGVKSDKEFHKLRHHIFKGDIFILLYEENKNTQEKNLFIILDKNPRFFYVLGENNKAYTDYQLRVREITIKKAKLGKDIITDEDLSNDELRSKLQASWRKQLIEEVMTLPNSSDRVFCAFTGIAATYPQLSPLFRASHIKGLKDPETAYDEKFDLYNGLLLSANADALFDKHLITVGEDKQLIFSFYLDNDYELKRDLLLLKPIMSLLLNEKRMKYLEYHRNYFYKEEQKRKSKNYVEQDEECLLD